MFTDSIQAVGQAVLGPGQDRGLVFHDPALQLHESIDPAAAGPADPLLQRSWAPSVVVKTGRSPAGPPSTGRPGAAEGRSWRSRPAWPAGWWLGSPGSSANASGHLSTLWPDWSREHPSRHPRVMFQASRRTWPSASVRTMWNGSGQRTAFGHRCATTVLIQSALSALTWLISADRSAPLD